jgi:hypothetical protein
MAEEITRRDVLKRAVYITPVILSLPVAPSYAKSGSGKCNNGLGNGIDCQPAGDPKPNDISGIPGRPHQ